MISFLFFVVWVVLWAIPNNGEVYIATSQLAHKLLRDCNMKSIYDSSATSGCNFPFSFLIQTSWKEGELGGRENKISVLKNSVVKRFNSLQDKVGSCMKSTWTTWNSEQLLDIAVYCRVGKEHWKTNGWYNFQILLDTYVS